MGIRVRQRATPWSGNPIRIVRLPGWPVFEAESPPTEYGIRDEERPGYLGRIEVADGEYRARPFINGFYQEAVPTKNSLEAFTIITSRKPPKKDDLKPVAKVSKKNRKRVGTKK